MLLCALLKSNGIEASPLLVDTYKTTHLADYLPTPTNFNHAVARIRVSDAKSTFSGEKSFLYIDPTYSLQGGTTSKFYFPSYGQGLLLEKGQKDIISIPNQNAGYVTVEEEMILPATTDTSDRGLLTIKTVYFEGEADFTRSQFQQSTIAQTEENYLNYYRDIYKNIEFESVDSLEYYDQRDANNFSVVERYFMKNVWKQDVSTQKYQASILGKMLYDQLVILPNRPQNFPVALKYPYHLTYIIRVKMPGPWAVPNDNWEIKRAAYEVGFNSTFRAENNTWELSYDYQTLQDHVAAGQILEFKQDMERLVGNLEYQLVYQEPNMISTSGLNLWMVVFGLLVLAGGTALCLRLYRYSPELALNSDAGLPLGGWLVLVGISTVVLPFTIIYTIFAENFNVYFTEAGWNMLAGRAELLEATYHGLAIAEVLINTLMLCVSVLLIVLYFQKRDSFPKIFIGLHGVGLLFLVVDTLVVWFMTSMIESDTTNTIVRQAIYVSIWIPYMLKSQRVQDTFVNRHGEETISESSQDSELVEEW